MKTSEILRAWRKILKGEPSSLSIEITRERPLQRPGCYAYQDAHLGGGVALLNLAGRTGQELINGVLEGADRVRPLHLSLVVGDPLVRCGELDYGFPFSDTNTRTNLADPEAGPGGLVTWVWIIQSQGIAACGQRPAGTLWTNRSN